MDLILLCIGMNRFTNHSRTPTTIRAITICIKGMLCTSFFAPRHPEAVRFAWFVVWFEDWCEYKKGWELGTYVCD